MIKHFIVAKTSCQRGITLIEVLISVLVISFAVLGAATLQLNSLKNSMAMEYRAQATFLANDMLERMRAVRGSDLSGYLITTTTPAVVADPLPNDPPPPAPTLAENDLREWGGMVRSTLPSGDASIQVNGNAVTLTFRWQQNSPDIGGGVQNMTFVIEAMI